MLKFHVFINFFMCLLRFLVSIQKSAAIANKFPSPSPFPLSCISQIIQSRSSKIKGMACVCVQVSRILPLPCFPLYCGVDRGVVQPAPSLLVNNGSNTGWGLPNPPFIQTQGLGWAALGPPCLWLATIRTPPLRFKRPKRKAAFTRRQQTLGSDGNLASPNVCFVFSDFRSLK